MRNKFSNSLILDKERKYAEIRRKLETENLKFLQFMKING